MYFLYMDLSSVLVHEENNIEHGLKKYIRNAFYAVENKEKEWLNLIV